MILTTGPSYYPKCTLCIAMHWRNWSSVYLFFFQFIICSIIDAVVSDDCLHLQGGLPPGPQRFHVVVFGGGVPKIVHFSQKTPVSEEGVEKYYTLIGRQ